MRVLGFDPGVRNFAFAVYDTVTESVTAIGWLRGAEVNQTDHYFIDSVLEALDTHKPDLVGIERFAFRKEASVESEPINIMIGKLDLLARMRGYKTVLIMPAHWKVKFHTKELTHGAKDLFPGTKFEAIHQADAAGIAKYVYEARRDKIIAADEKAERAAAKMDKAAAKALATAEKATKKAAKLAAKTSTTQWTCQYCQVLNTQPGTCKICGS